MFRAYLTSVSLVVVCLTSVQAALLPPPHSAACVATLVAAREISGAGGISEARRLFGVLNQRWGKTSADSGDKTLPMTFEKFDLDSQRIKDPSEIQERLGQQLSSLDRSIQELELPENERTFSFITGASLVGQEAIAAYFAKKKELANYFATIQKPQNGAERIILALYLLIIYLSTNGLVSEVSSLVTAMDDSLQAGFPHPQVFASAIWGTYFGEMSARMALDRDWFSGERFRDWQSASAEPSSSRRWLYRSMTRRVPSGTLGLSRESRGHSLLVLGMRVKDTDTAIGRFFQEKFLRFKSQDHWIFVDELLSRDPQTQEPVLSVLVRLTDDRKRPRAPKRKKEAKEAQRKLVEDSL